MALHRPALFVPIGVNVATGKTGTSLLEKFGPEGIAVWVCFLAACKRSRVQGRIVYVSDAEGWDILGLAEHRPSFTLDDFFKFTGRLKQTRCTRSGRTRYVVSTRWEEWNNAAKREAARQQKARIRRESEPDTDRTVTGHEPDSVRSSESEKESEKELSTSDRSEGTPRTDLNGHTPIEKLKSWADRDLTDDGKFIEKLLRGQPEIISARIAEGIRGKGQGIGNRAAYLRTAIEREIERHATTSNDPLPGEPV